MSRITNVRHESRLHCSLRGRSVVLTWTHVNGVSIGSVPDDSPPTVRDEYTGELLPWVLTDAELQDLMELL